MSTAQYCDRYSSTLSSGYTSGGVSISVTSAGSGASTLPTTGDFYLLVEAEGGNTEEVFKVTARSGTTLTVVGAQAGTSASNHASGATIRGPIWTSSGITLLRSSIVGTLTYSAFMTATTNGTVQGGYDTINISDGFHRCVWSGSAWVYYIDGIRVTPPPALASFTQVNVSTTTFTEDHFSIKLETPAATAATDNLRLLILTAGVSAPYKLEVGWMINGNFGSDRQGVGAVWYQDTTHIAVNRVLVNSTSGRAHAVTRYNSVTNGVANDYLVASYLNQAGRLILFRIQDDNANRLAEISGNGVDWYQVNSQGRTANSITATQVGAFVNSPNETGNYRLVHFKQS